MSFPQAPEANRRTRWFRIALSIWLLFISLSAIIDNVGLSRLSKQTRHSEQETHVKTLNARVADLAQQMDASRHQPQPASQADFLAAHQALEERLVRIEQAQAAAAPASDMQALQNRVSAIEAIEHRDQATRATAAPRHPQVPVATRPHLLVPPFRIVGTELRGGARFLSVAAPDATSLASFHLLREGDSDRGWQLQSIDAHAAVFVVKGQTQRIALP